MNKETHMLGIVDVGGGTRGIYGAGVLDYCMDQGIRADYFIGVSAGAANGASYVAGQRGRNLVFYNDYAFRKDYMGVGNFLKKGSYINLDYIYSTLSDAGGENPLDYQSLQASPMELEIVATNADTGRAVYFNKKDLGQNFYDPIKASCCVPVLCKPYPVEGIPYFDGGISDPIPFRRAFQAGCTKAIVILTKPRDFFREEDADRRLVLLLKRKYPQAAQALEHRAEVYNRSLRELLKLEKEGKAIIIAPSDTGNLRTLTQDHDELLRLYEMGKRDGENRLGPEFGSGRFGKI